MSRALRLARRSFPYRAGGRGTMVLAAASFALAGCSVLGIGPSQYPPTSSILPLPQGDTIVLNLTFPPGGSDNIGNRVVVVSFHGESRAVAKAAMVRALRGRGWTKAMCSPKGDPCAMVGMSMADFSDQWSASNETEPRKIESVLADPRRPVFLIFLADV
jgi:hypothetical protein